MIDDFMDFPVISRSDIKPEAALIVYTLPGRLRVARASVASFLYHSEAAARSCYADSVPLRFFLLVGLGGLARPRDPHVCFLRRIFPLFITPTRVSTVCRLLWMT